MLGGSPALGFRVVFLHRKVMGGKPRWDTFFNRSFNGSGILYIGRKTSFKH